MKIINKIKKDSWKYAIKFNEQYDWFPDDTLQELRDYQTDEKDNFEMVNWEANREEPPVFEIDDEMGGILVDEIGEEPIVEPIVEEPTDIVDETVEEETEIDERVPDFANAQQALQWAIDNNRVVEIFYVTQGRKRGRGGKILRREIGLSKNKGGGVHIHRIVEPHYIYKAGNNNIILITYDRSVGHIRAFIIDNIYDYNFTKNRKTKKDQYFKPRIRVMPKANKGIKKMENIKNKLTKIASNLESKGLSKSSLVIKDAIKTASEYKMAQYVGVQGYWLKNRRCWDNCYRNKRTSKPDTSAQEVWMECWDEYKDSINNSDSGWEKYAEKNNNIKLNKKEEQTWNKIFADKVNNRVKEGFSRPEAIYTIIEDESQKYTSKIIEASSDLMTLSDSFVKNGQEEIGKQIAEVATEMLKEAGIFNWMGEKVKNWAAGKGKILKQLREFADNAGHLASLLRQQVKYNRTNRAAKTEIKIKKEGQLTQTVDTSDQVGQPESPQQVSNPTNNPATEPQTNLIQQAYGIATAADQLISWIGENIPSNNPRVEKIVQRANVNLSQGADQIRSYLSQPKGINYVGIAEKLESMAKGANMAMQEIYQEDKPTSDSTAPGQQFNQPTLNKPIDNQQFDTPITIDQIGDFIEESNDYAMLSKLKTIIDNKVDRYSQEAKIG